MSKTALITGITGQDGAYLAKFLVGKGYKVFGGLRRTSSSDFWRLRELGIQQAIELVPFELCEESNITQTIAKLQVDELYNLGAQSFVGGSFDTPLYTTQVDAVGTCRILEAIRTCSPNTKFYQASTSEMFGRATEVPQKETTPFYPRSPYAVAKLYAHWITKNYRESYDLFCCSGILFNHESPLRGPEFVTRKTSIELAKIRHGQRDPLRLGNLNARRDWGFAGDYVTGMWMMLNAVSADDYVLATGSTWTIREFVERAASVLGYHVEWSGVGAAETGTDRKTGKVLVTVDPKFYRPAEVDCLKGDASKAREILGWRPEISFGALVEMMVRADNDRITAGK